jgi:hypothetical protein
LHNPPVVPWPVQKMVAAIATPTSSTSAVMTATSPTPPLAKRRRKRRMTTVPSHHAGGSVRSGVARGGTLSAPRPRCTRPSPRWGRAPSDNDLYLLGALPRLCYSEAAAGCSSIPFAQSLGAGTYRPRPRVLARFGAVRVMGIGAETEAGRGGRTTPLYSLRRFPCMARAWQPDKSCVAPRIGAERSRRQPRQGRRRASRHSAIRSSTRPTKVRGTRRQIDIREGRRSST